jgi:hypothetical protein
MKALDQRIRLRFYFLKRACGVQALAAQTICDHEQAEHRSAEQHQRSTFIWQTLGGGQNATHQCFTAREAQVPGSSNKFRLNAVLGCKRLG